jgi:GTP-binding protein
MAARGGSRFIDEVRVDASSGAGGDGRASFRREKFVPRGGPNGGDGGRGGHVIFEADASLNTLHNLRFTPIIKAKRGGDGGLNQKNGRAGEDRVVLVPPGTEIRSDRGELLAELLEAGDRAVVLHGGQGGRGNVHFKSSQNRAPTQAEPGGAGEQRMLCLELKLLADVGLLGFPNAGKSTLISRLSAARPRVAAYPFTTLEPSLGVVSVPGTYQTFVVADIPGLIEGAADGTGLGHQFLRHVERCRVLLHLVSLDPVEDEATGDALDRFAKINHELERYDPDLARRPQVVLLSKSDLVDEATVDAVRARFLALGHEVFVGSAVTGAGMNELIFALALRVASDGDPS